MAYVMAAPPSQSAQSVGPRLGLSGRVAAAKPRLVVSEVVELGGPCPFNRSTTRSADASRACVSSRSLFCAAVCHSQPAVCDEGAALRLHDVPLVCTQQYGVAWPAAAL
jgi:hypothetical protein